MKQAMLKGVTAWNHSALADDIPVAIVDPFDRILVAQAIVEGITLLTNDRRLVGYPGPIRKV